MASRFGFGVWILTNDLQVMSLIPGHNDINDLPENVRKLGTAVDRRGIIWTRVDPLPVVGLWYARFFGWFCFSESREGF